MKSVVFITAIFLSIPLLVASLPLNDEGSNAVQQHESKLKRQCVPNRSLYDDSSYRLIEYIGDWTYLTNQGSSVMAFSLAYTGQANA